MSVWHDALIDLIDPIEIPNSSSDSSSVDHQPKSSKDISDNSSPLIPLYLFLAGCYLDAKEYAIAEKFCRQGLQICLSTNHHNNNTEDDGGKDTEITEKRQLGVRLVQELMSCWEENPEISNAQCCEYSRGLVEWLQEAFPWVGNYWQDAWQRPAFVHPKAPSRAVCAVQDQPAWCKVLENHSDMILEECQELLHTKDWRQLPRVGDGDHRQGAGAHDGMVVSPGGDWREVVLFGAGAVSNGKEKIAPKTRKLLELHCPDAVSLANQGGGEVIFSILAPQTRIAPHCASTNLRWTAHLGLIIPTNGRVQIRVANEWHNWQKGKMLVFDDSYEHEVINECMEEIRVVLLIRFWNPFLPAPLRAEALQKALDWKANEQERRFHPPVLPSNY